MPATVHVPSKRLAMLAGVGVALLIVVVVGVAALRPKPAEANQGLRWWRFEAECGRRKSLTLVLAPDRSTAIANMCRRTCGTFEGTPIYQQCEQECSREWQRGQSSGKVWAHEAGCRYGVEREDWP